MASLPLIGPIKKSFTVSPSETKVAHSVPLSTFNTLDYIVNIRNSDQTKVKSFRFVVNKSSLSLSDTVSSILGSYFNSSIVAIINGLNAEIIINNQESFLLEVNFKCENT